MKLEIGTEMCQIHYDRWDHQYTYTFSKVVKLTAKRAELATGGIIDLTPKNDSHGTFFKTWGGKYTQYWYFSTPEIREAQRAYEEKKAIERWFSDQKFTIDQKKQIYDLFK